MMAEKTQKGSSVGRMERYHRASPPVTEAAICRGNSRQYRMSSAKHTEMTFFFILYLIGHRMN